MILLTRKDCPFCPPDLPGRIAEKGGHVFMVVRHPDGKLYMKVSDGIFELLPAKIVALPSLIAGERIYSGLQPIEDFLSTNPSIA